MFADYICPNCNYKEFIQKVYGKPWQDVYCEQCQIESDEQKFKMVRQFGIPTVSIGKGYDGIIYNPSPFTPVSQIPGMRGVQAGVESDSE